MMENQFERKSTCTGTKVVQLLLSCVPTKARRRSSQRKRPLQIKNRPCRYTIFLWYVRPVAEVTSARGLELVRGEEVSPETTQLINGE